jgi:hypothetical protein
MDRTWCIQTLLRITLPVFTALSENRLKETFPSDGSPFAPMEAFARCLVGIAPYVERNTDEDATKLAALARRALARATNPQCKDFMPFAKPHQSLVEAGLIAFALLHAPSSLWDPLPPHVQQNVFHALRSTHTIPVRENNWVLFGSIIEAFFLSHGAAIDEKRLLLGVERMEKWYLGDGVYGDGPPFHMDYYNSIIIHPLLYTLLNVLSTKRTGWKPRFATHQERVQRWAAIQERMIAPDGSFPPLGRSLAYRCGLFHGLAFACLHKELPPSLPPAQARTALLRVVRRTLDASQVLRDGWLTIGLSGEQPTLGENYINRGSAYMCCAAFLPLGLPPTDPFWSDPDHPTSWDRAWSGEDNLPRDHALGYTGSSPVCKTR